MKYICNPVSCFSFFFPEVTAASMANLAGLLKEKGRRGIAIIPAATSVGVSAYNLYLPVMDG